jgi:hypothetical protein
MWRMLHLSSHFRGINMKCKCAAGCQYTSRHATWHPFRRRTFCWRREIGALTPEKHASKVFEKHIDAP